MSLYKQQSVLRRDERHTALPYIRKPSGSKRDTKRWCRGVIGREHVLECVSYNLAKHTTVAPTDWRILRCSVCAKTLDYYWPTIRSKRPPPSWVKP